ncbi:SEC-C metal-binding domain-containing protein [Peribacillus frigoritolerans]|uniref:SEC-C metal-binding domain-containing protein n=1 Tax=Peribacillus frigoritolerans TaxID=450367 RepID=UPI001F4F2E4E|nr:SEC-C metal-binding domain-containing protein [Peribacillus frigoritolerans]MCK2016350.1 SEC-C domain-containing protein [Peribacillus frigoritolerans]
MKKYDEKFKVDLAYAYALNGEYKKSIDLCNEISEDDFGSVVHMTRGLVYVGLGEFDLAFQAYELGIHACMHKWFPVAKENLEIFIQEKNIDINENLNNILFLLSKERKPLKRKNSCYCNSGKKFKNCHGTLIF